MAGNNNLGRQQSTSVSASVATQSDGATSLVMVTLTQNIPDVAAAPTGVPTKNGAMSRFGSAATLAALAVFVAGLF